MELILQIIGTGMTDYLAFPSHSNRWKISLNFHMRIWSVNCNRGINGGLKIPIG